jgi:subtilisin-like proprotein convertase family protein
MTGRSGAGRIFVWAAGDGRLNGDNCNFDGYANSRFGIAVGAVTDTGLQAPYSEPCSALLVSAPSSGTPGINRGLTTTDLLEADGIDPTDYTDAFGGTAGAAPVVSGIAALMLAKNPALTWRDVQHILVRTSRPVDVNDASWSLGTFPHSERYGFGVVDALAAVTSAATWRNVLPEKAVPDVTHAVGATIPDNNAVGVSDSIFIGGAYAGFSVEHVEVEFTAAHPRRGDLEVTLTSPAGIVSHLGTVRPGDTGANFVAWRFRSVRHWGESAAGAWTLTVADRASGKIGVFTSWTLRIYGTSPAFQGGGGVVLVNPNLPAGSAGGNAPANGHPVVSLPFAPGLVSDPVGVGSPARPSPMANDSGSFTGGTAAGLAAAPQPASGASPSGQPTTTSPGKGEGERTRVGDSEVEAPPASKSDPESRPDAPIGLAASVSGSTVMLRWRPAISGARPTGYILEAGSTPGDSNVFVLPLGDLSASFTARNVKGGTYFVRVRASNAGGPSEASNEAKVVVGDCTAPPSAPNGLSFSLNGSAVVLTWEASKSGPTSYIIETETGSDGNSPGVVDTGSLKTTFTAEDVPPGTYFVRVRARNACGGSARSEKVTVVVR